MISRRIWVVENFVSHQYYVFNFQTFLYVFPDKKQSSEDADQNEPDTSAMDTVNDEEATNEQCK